MHELPITERILDVVLRHAAGQDVHRIVRVHLRVGALADLEDHWIQHYFQLSQPWHAGRERGTCNHPCADFASAAGRAPAHSKSLGKIWGKATCPGCGETGCELVVGREYFIENMEVL